VSLLGAAGGSLQYWYSYDLWLPPETSGTQAFVFGMAAGVVGVYLIANPDEKTAVGKLVAMALVFGFSAAAVLSKAQTLLTSETAVTSFDTANHADLDKEIKDIRSALENRISVDPAVRKQEILDLGSKAEYLIDLAEMANDEGLRRENKDCLFKIRSLFTECASTGDGSAVSEASGSVHLYALSRNYEKVAGLFEKVVSTSQESSPADRPDSGWIKYCNLKDANIKSIDLNSSYDGDRIFTPANKSTFSTDWEVSPETPTAFPKDVTTVTDVYVRSAFPTPANLPRPSLAGRPISISSRALL
jgi:hypothetical protein